MTKGISQYMQVHAVTRRPSGSPSLKSRPTVYIVPKNQSDDQYRTIFDESQSTFGYCHAQNQFWGSACENEKSIGYNAVSLPFLSKVITNYSCPHSTSYWCMCEIYFHPQHGDLNIPIISTPREEGFPGEMLKFRTDRRFTGVLQDIKKTKLFCN